MAINDTIEEKRRYQREWNARRRAAWVESQGGRCVQCGSTDRLEVDHIDPALKQYEVRQLWSRRAEVREAELAKCQLLCKTCHDVKSAREESPHGTRRRYQHHGCRCAECRRWNADRVTRQRSN